MRNAWQAKQLDRALGALTGLALGDALGMPTQTLSPKEIIETYGEIRGFVAASESQPVSHGLPAASITDDTEQTLLLARHLTDRHGDFDEVAWAEMLVAWEADVKARGVADLLGPSTKRALDALLNGQPAQLTGRFGDTNGAAMRIAPVGIEVPTDPLAGLVQRVAETCRITHNTGLAIAAAAAVAAAVSAGIEGASWDDVKGIALAAAREGESYGHWAAGGSIARRIELALSLGDNSSRREATADIATIIGTSVAAQESVPAAFGLLEATGGDPWQAALASANIGGDTDTIGAIAGAIGGACRGAGALPGDQVRRVVEVNALNLGTIAEALLALRGKRMLAAARLEEAR